MIGPVIPPRGRRHIAPSVPACRPALERRPDCEMEAEVTRVMARAANVNADLVRLERRAVALDAERAAARNDFIVGGQLVIFVVLLLATAGLFGAGIGMVLEWMP